MKHWGSVPIILLASFCLGAGPAFLLQDTIQRPEPFESTPLRVNPPTFRWPAEKGAREYELQLSRSPEFRDPQTAKVSAQFYRPLQPLAAGRWHWRVRPSGGKWPAAPSFEIGEQLPKWPVPEWSEMIARIPQGRPRIYLRPEDVAAWRARAKGPVANLVGEWAARTRKLVGKGLQLDDDPGRPARATRDPFMPATRSTRSTRSARFTNGRPRRERAS